mgnify:CR=1 FL=1|tara:strand:- start:362 stop:1270 length:909 start_codon:yes stop_codon:yes gene_type:complete
MSLAIGFTNVYYTLWSIRVDGVYSDDGRLMGNNVTSTYLKNLSKDKDQAIAKAKELGATDLVPDDSLKGYKNFTYYQPTEEEKQRRKDLEKQQELDRKENIKTKFIKGKYIGKTFEEVNEIDADYLWWYFTQLIGVEEEDKLIESVLRNKFEWIREKDDEILRIRKFKDGKHFKEKEKVEISVEVLFDSESWEGRYGTTYKYLLGYDTDKELTYLGSKDLGLNKRDIVTLKGTIKHKQHGTDMYETRIQRVKVVEEKEEPKTNPKSELEKALKGIRVAIQLSGETEDLIKAKKGIEMALKLI